jgi:hypothetical protein
LKGANAFQTWAAPGIVVRPKKNARYAVLDMKMPFGVHFQEKESWPVPGVALCINGQSLRY